MKRFGFYTTMVTGCLFLAACAASDDGGGVALPTTPTYQKLASKANKTSTLGGVAIRTNNKTADVELVKTSGTLKHKTAGLTIKDDKYTFKDPNGYNTSKIATDGKGATVKNQGTNGFSGTYEYVTTYNSTYTSGTTKYDNYGIYGIITASKDIPKSGKATYKGGARGTVITAATGVDLENGKSTVVVDFGTKKVDVTLHRFTAKDVSTGTLTDSPVDTIKLKGMTITKNRFTGGTMQTLKSGAAVDITGTNTNTQAKGAFFGYDKGAKTPDEVGGILFSKGDSGIVSGTFVAD